MPCDSRTKHTGKGLCERNNGNDGSKVRSKAPNKHAEEKGRQALSPTGVRAILDIASNFARQFSPQSQGCRPWSWLPLTKEFLEEPPSSPTYSEPTAALGSLKHGEELETFRGAFGIAYTTASVSPWGVSAAVSLVTGFGQARVCKAPARPGERRPRLPRPPCPGRRWKPRGEGRGARPLRAARHVGAAAGEGRGAVPRSHRRFSHTFHPSRLRGSSSTAAALGAWKAPLSPPCVRGWCFGPPRPARTPPPGSTAGPAADAPCPAGTAGCGRRRNPIGRLRLQLRAAHRRRPRAPGWGQPEPQRAARPGPPRYIPSGHSPHRPQGSWRNPLPFHPARCLTKHRIMKRVKINPTCWLPAPSLLPALPQAAPAASSQEHRFPHLA